MALRHRFHAIVLVAGLATGTVALPVVAVQAAPAKKPVIHDDPLAVVAAHALIAFTSYQRTDNTTVLEQFVTKRDELAAALAARLDIEPARMQAAWRRADPQHQKALVAALSQLGVRYRRNTSNPGVGFDCSGLTTFAWGQAGTVLQRQSRAQIANSRTLTRDTAQAGDLVYYPGHIMMYLGVDDAVVHAPYTGRTVEVASISKRHARTVRFGNPA